MSALDDTYNTSSQSYRDFLRMQAQEDLKNMPQPLNTPPSAQPLISPTTTADLFKSALENPQASQSASLLPMGVRMPLGHQATILGKPTSLTQAFGNNNPGVEVFSHGFNSGADFAADPGTPVALPDGQWKILSAYSGDNTPGHIGDSTNSGYGNSVFAQNEKTGEKLRFSHLSQVDVNPGDEIQGGIIGQTGQTGNVTGPHLDLEYYDQNGQLQDVLNSIYGQYLDMGK